MPGPTVLTVDELTWSQRSSDFRSALADGDFAATVAAPRGSPATQPGVTTMWIGALALESTDLVAGSPLRRAHQLHGVVCALWLIPFIVASRRVIGRRAALIAGGILAVEPLLVGHSAVLHTDALLTMSVGTALMALLAAFDSLRREQASGSVLSWRSRFVAWSVLAGVSSAFAALTKVTALLLLGPAVAAVVVAHLALGWRAGRGAGREARMAELGLLARILGICAVSGLAVSLIAWPALWVSPASALLAAAESTRLADDVGGRFFLGEVTTGGDWRFYAVHAVFLASPWVFAGSLVAAGWAVARRLSGLPRTVPRRVAAVLWAATVPYVVVISTSNKQYGRYLLPLLPVVAVALAAVVDRWLAGVRPRAAAAVASTALAVTAVFTLSLAPYQISHVNLLVGGQRAAQEKIHLGWREGMERVGTEFRFEEECPRYSSASGWIHFVITQCAAVPFDWLDGTGPPPDFVLRYVFTTQLGDEPDGLVPFLRENAELAYTVTIDGVNYVEVWQVDRRVPERAAS